jgi:hypothetical protein
MRMCRSKQSGKIRCITISEDVGHRVIGAPRGSSYFASIMGQAVLAQFEADFGVGQEAPEKVTYIPLDGEGTVDIRVEKSVGIVLQRD